MKYTAMIANLNALPLWQRICAGLFVALVITGPITFAALWLGLRFGKRLRTAFEGGVGYRVGGSVL